MAEVKNQIGSVLKRGKLFRDPDKARNYAFGRDYLSRIAYHEGGQ